MFITENIMKTTEDSTSHLQWRAFCNSAAAAVFRENKGWPSVPQNWSQRFNSSTDTYRIVKERSFFIVISIESNTMWPKDIFRFSPGTEKLSLSFLVLLSCRCHHCSLHLHWKPVLNASLNAVIICGSSKGILGNWENWELETDSAGWGSKSQNNFLRCIRIVSRELLEFFLQCGRICWSLWSDPQLEWVALARSGLQSS